MHLCASINLNYTLWDYDFVQSGPQSGPQSSPVQDNFWTGRSSPEVLDWTDWTIANTAQIERDIAFVLLNHGLKVRQPPDDITTLARMTTKMIWSDIIDSCAPPEC